MPQDDVASLITDLPKMLEPVVQLLKEPNVCSDEMIVELSIKAIDTLEFVQSGELICFIFNAIAKYVTSVS